MVEKIIIVLFALAKPVISPAQIKCDVQIRLDRHEVYVQQPFKVTFTLTTATWFTSPPVFDNIQVPNAFVVPFSKTQPGMFPVNGKQYAGIQFYFIVFPYEPGRYILPALDIMAETPPVGGYIGRKVRMKTREQHFIVKPIPDNLKEADGFVAKNVSISEKWNRPLNNLKIGDVLERAVTINATGTLPQFIPVMKRDSLNWASVYANDAVLTDTRNDYEANGRVTQKFTYLLEKAGENVFPEEQIRWWNPYSGKIYTRSTSRVRINVKENPDLGILTTIRDSLRAKNVVSHTKQAETKRNYLIFGIPWYWFFFYLITACFTIYFTIHWAGSVYRSLLQRYSNYRLSELSGFRRFMRSPLGLPIIFKNLYSWWDRFRDKDKLPGIALQAYRQQEPGLVQELDFYLKQIYETGDMTKSADRHFKNEIKRFRNRMKSVRSPGHDQCQGSLDQQMWPL